jgi:biopolymer transport protein TolR
MHASGRRARGNRLAMSAEVNLINLVDVALVLLIIFMITAPIMQGGVEVKLPQSQTAPLTSANGVMVSVTRNGAIFIGDVPVASLEEFRTLYPKIVRTRNAHDAYVRGDKDVPYGRVLQVLGMMKQLDVAEVGLVAEPLQEQ